MVGDRPSGTVLAVHGNVVDVGFPVGLPPLRRKLATGQPGAVVLEVANHLDARTARCIALTPTRGLARGATVTDTGGPLQVPVGEALLGRMLNVFGEVIDGGEAPAGLEWQSIHRPRAESLASEHASRLASMQAAERNIEERLAEQEAQFLRRRQEVITEELLDIATGFAASTSMAGADTGE